MEGPSRYLIGIDLGTTNCAVAFIDTDEPINGTSPRIHDFAVPQLTAPGEVRPAAVLPSFLYFPTEEEVSSGLVNLPWEEHPSAIVGIMARDYGALAPSRQVSSAKSWLSQDAVDRTANILPRDAEPPEPSISPVEASTRYLLHLRNAWNHSMSEGNSVDPRQLFENQEIVLTVPASFDEEARELTVEAARQAGVKKLTLLEEPLAAFYAWVAEHQGTLAEHLRDGEVVLICDIGGGTSDFSLIRAHVHNGEVELERTAIGEHLLLGGENVDLALARRVEEKIGTKLSLRQSHALRVTCSAAKERLLNDINLDRLPINVLGGGRAVVGQTITSELTRHELNELLVKGFLPLTDSDAMPVRTRALGLREIGLPYVTDPAITKHLAAFLKRAAVAMGRGNKLPNDDNIPLVRPDAILFNGGFCIPAIVRDRITEAIANWFSDRRGWCPKALNDEVRSGAVAIGATYYGLVRQGAGLRVKAGSARTFYVGMRSDQGVKAVCLLPAGTNEGTTLPLPEREFSVLANRPVSFRLYSSTVRNDAHGTVADLSLEQVHRHSPLVTLLRYGKKLQQTELAVRLSVSFTEVGTLELWCESVNSPHRWRLQFELRGEGNSADKTESMSPPALTPIRHGVSVSEAMLTSAVRLIPSTFSRSAELEKSDAVDPGSLSNRLESVIGLRRESWTLPIARSLCDALLEVSEGRRFSPSHELRWLNLFGYCLRPGFGDRSDNLRTAQAARIFQAGLIFPRELQCQVDWLVLWRRIAGGLSAVHQQKLWKYLGEIGVGSKKPRTRLNPQVEHEGWRLLASLEHLPASTRTVLGTELLRKIKKEPSDGAWLWSLGRVGARIPLYGSLNCVVPAECASEWISALLEMRKVVPETASAIIQLGRCVEDQSRDIDPRIAEFAIAKLKAAGVADEDLLRPLVEFTRPVAHDVARTFGESLPRGLELESTSNSLSPVTALAHSLT